MYVGGAAKANDPAGPVGPVRRRVVRTREYTDVAVPLDLLLNGGSIEIYPDLLRTGVVRTYSRDGKIIFQAGGLVGFIPLNDRVALEIEPRVPIGNLERILLLAGNSSPVVLSGHLSSFKQSAVALPQSLLDVLASRLAALTEACWNEGLHSDYVQRVRVGQSPRGRIKVYETSQARIRSNSSLVMVSEQFERTHDTAPNECIAAALDQLHQIYSGIRNKAGVRVLASRLGRARNLLPRYARGRRDFLTHPLVADPRRLPVSRPSYPAAVALAKIVLSGAGVELRNRNGELSLPPMIIRMETVFESYLRVVLASNEGEILALDGNLDPPSGASTNLFHSAPDHSHHKDARSTPDIVCALASSPGRRLVIDAKYKLDVTRDDINQVLGYALTFRARSVMLACPRKSEKVARGLQLLGEVAGVSVLLYRFDLNAVDLELEESAFRAEVSALLAALP